MVEIDKFTPRIAHGAVDLLLNICPGTYYSLRSYYLSRSQPAPKKIEKMHAMLNKNPATFGTVPKPMIRGKKLITSVILEISMQQFPQSL